MTVMMMIQVSTVVTKVITVITVTTVIMMILMMMQTAVMTAPLLMGEETSYTRHSDVILITVVSGRHVSQWTEDYCVDKLLLPAI